MAKKVSDAIAKQLKKLGIKNVKTEDEAREKLLAILEKNGIEGMEDEDTESLIDMAESFIEDDDDEDTETAEAEETDSDESEDEDEDEDEELADEAEEDEDEDEKPAKKSAKKQDKKPAKKAAKKSDEDDEDEDDAEEDEDDEDEKPAKKSAKKQEAKKADKKPAAKKQSSSRGVKLYPQKNEDDRSYFKPLHKVFSPKEFDYSWVSTSGVNIRNNGGNSKRSLVLIENCTIKQKDGKDVVFCNLYFPILNGHTECLDEAGIDYKPCWNGAPMIKEIPMEEAIEIIEEVLDELVKLAGKIDKRLGDNRKKMEASLKKNEKKAAKSSKKSKDEDEDDEDEDEEDDEPKKKAKKSAPAPKKSKKAAEPEDEDDEEDDEEEDEKPAKKAKKSKK
jgi:hypothetical protein